MIWYRRLLWSTTLLSLTLLSDSQVSISLVIHGLWWTVSRQVKAHVVLTYTNGVSPNFQWLCPATDYEWHCWHVPVNKIWRRTESTPRSGWWGSHMAGIYRDWSTREINNTVPSVLWRCWLGGRKGIRPAKNWVVGCWRGYLSGARCRLAYGPAEGSAIFCPVEDKTLTQLIN